MTNGNGKTILTNSAINAFKSCARKYYWRYVREIEVLARPEALLLGSAIHGFLESHYRQLPYSMPSDLNPKSQAILKGVAEFYPILFMDDADLFDPVAIEKTIHGAILNPQSGRPAREYAYGGKIDGLVVLKKDVEDFKAGDLLLLEHKTTTKVDENYFDRLQLDSQLRLYVLFLARELGAPVAGCLFNVILKPRLRPRKNESEEEYGHRLRLEMNWPEMYHRRYLRFSDQRLQEIQKELWDAKTLIAKARKENVFTMNSASCFDWHRRCDYFDLCASQDPETAIKESGLFQHQEAHVELVTGPGEVFFGRSGRRAVLGGNMNEIKQSTGNNNPHVILLYGQSKIGLSSIAAQFPAPLFLNINDDLEQIKTRSLRVGSWDEFLEHALEISKGKYAPQTIIVSHIDGLWDLAQDFVVESFNKLNGANVKALADASYSLWKEALKLFESKLVKLSGLGNLVLLAHEIVENRNFNGIERSVVQANLERYVQSKVTNLADAIGRVLLTESGARLVTFQPAPHQITGSRLTELLQKQYVIETGKKPEFIDELENLQQKAKKIA